MSSRRPRVLAALMIAVVALAATAVSTRPPAGATPALGGLDPVLLVDEREVMGSVDLERTRSGFVYRFSSEISLERFDADPARYEIQAGGDCAVMRGTRADPEIFAIHERRIYAFGSEGCRKAFLERPEAFSATARQDALRVAIVVYDGVELLDFTGPGEVFGVAPGFEPFTVAAEQDAVTSQGFVTIVPQHTFEDSPTPDVLVIPGGDARALTSDAAALEWIRRAADGARLVLSVCTGALVLAEAGLLDGIEVTTHHGALAALRTAAPQSRIVEGRRVVDAGRIVTSAGVTSGIDASLHVVARFADDDTANGIARYIAYLAPHAREETDLDEPQT